MSLDTTGVGMIVLSNSGSAADAVKKVEVKNVGTAIDNGKAVVNGVIDARSVQHEVTFYLNSGMTFTAPASGQQVTAVISMASGTTITQTLTVIASTTAPTFDTFSTGPQVRITSMSIDSDGSGTVFLSNSGAFDDKVLKISIMNVATVTGNAIWLADDSGSQIGPAVLVAESNNQQIDFDLSRDTTFSALASGQQVTAVISLASGATITQTITVVAPAITSGQFSTGPQVKIESMSLDTNGLGFVVMSNSSNSDDQVIKVEVKNVGAVTDRGGNAIWLMDNAGNPIGPGILKAYSSQQTIAFDLSNSANFMAPSSGQQVTTVISMASGATITQTLTVVWCC